MHVYINRWYENGLRIRIHKITKVCALKGTDWKNYDRVLENFVWSQTVIIADLNFFQWNSVVY